MFCPSCGKSIKDNSRFCLFCGADTTQFESEPKSSRTAKANCPKCGYSLEEDAAFCDNCGAKVSKPETAPVAEVHRPMPASKPVSIPDSQQISPVRGNNKVLRFILPIIILIGAAAFVFLWDGGSIWKGWLGSEPSTPTAESTTQTLEGAVPPSEDTDASPESAVPPPENAGNSDGGVVLSDIPQEELPPEEPLVNDGTLESALRFAAAVYLSESDSPYAEIWADTSVHVTYLSGDYCDFAVTVYDGGDGDRMVAQLNATLDENGGAYTASDVSLHWETVTLSHGENYFDNEHESVTNADPSAFTLIPNETKADTYMRFKREAEEAFTLNGVQIMSGVHDTRENFDAYAQPTKILLTVEHSGGASETVTLPVIPCEFQGFPFAIVLDEPIEDVLMVTLKFLETDGTQDYIAISEVSFF